MATPASPRDPSLEQRAAELQVQIEQVAVALQQIRQTHDSLQQVEGRLAEMTSECAGILDRWARNDEKHAAAVAELHGRLSEWNDLERKLLTESATRIHQFERGLQHEWQALKRRHEEPVQKLDAQATRIAENCLAAVDAALRGFDRAESRLAAMEQELGRQMAELTRDVREAIGELRPQALPSSAPRPWPLEEVVRLHTELRAEAADAPHDPPALEDTRPLAPAPPTRALLVPPVDLTPFNGVERRRPGVRRVWLGAGIAVAAILIAAVLHLGRRLDTELEAATSRAIAAEQEAETARRLARDQVEAVQRAAEERIASAQQAAQSAQLTANVLAAPDLYRLDLAGSSRAPRSAAQVLWSRSRGIVFSGSRLPVPENGATYQLWLVTQEGPVSVGTLQPEANGRATVGFAPPERLPRPVVGALVTLEPADGVAQPAGPTYLAAPPVAPSS